MCICQEHPHRLLMLIELLNIAPRQYQVFLSQSKLNGLTLIFTRSYQEMIRASIISEENSVFTVSRMRLIKEAQE